MCIFGFSNDSRGIEHTTPRTWFAMPSTACKENYLPGVSYLMYLHTSWSSWSSWSSCHYISLNMSLYFRLFDQRISGKHHWASSTTESSGLVTWPRFFFFFRKEHRHRVLIDSDLLWRLGCGWLWMAVEYVMWICGMDMNGWNSDFVEMVSLGARLTLSSLHSDCSHRRGSHMFQNRWTDG